MAVLRTLPLAASVLSLAALFAPIERGLLFYPTHRPPEGSLTPWVVDGQTIGFAREVARPRNVWLMTHGNGGQASAREYALPRFSSEDSVYVLEYPGYGQRPGTPSAPAFNAAAKSAYLALRRAHPGVPLCAVGESIGSGPASMLATLDPPPDKIVLIVPFERLSLVAMDHYPAFLIKLLLSDDWDNAKALAGYRGPIDIFGAEGDTIVPVRHAGALAAALPRARFTLIPGGHNDWSQQQAVRIENP